MLHLLALMAALPIGPCAGSPAEAQIQAREEAISRANGQLYAEKNCASCHAVVSGRTASPNPAAPSFPLIASTPGMTATALNAILHSPHRSMPNLSVEPGTIADLAAYMRSLRDPALTRQLRKKANEPAILHPLSK